MTKQNIIVIMVVAVGIVAAGVLLFVRGPGNDNNNLEKDWTYNTSNLCKVDIPLPPRQDRYITDKGEYWRFEEHQQEGDIFFKNTAVAILQNPELGGSGYVAGAVVVSCKEKGNYRLVDDVVKDFGNYFERARAQVPQEAQITLVAKRKVEMWGREVAVIGLKGGMFNEQDDLYVVLGDTMAYVISKPQHSTDPFVAQTTQHVLSGLKFR